MNYYHRHSNSLAGLLVAWNDATAPDVMRSEHEHKRCNQVARAITNRMDREGYQYGIDWAEDTFNSSRYAL